MLAPRTGSFARCPVVPWFPLTSVVWVPSETGGNTPRARVAARVSVRPERRPGAVTVFCMGGLAWTYSGVKPG
jgi:hypothetical protein